MQFSRTQLFFVLILFIGISNHVLIMPYLLATAKRDAWVSAIISYAILLIWGLLLYFIMKKNNERQSLVDWVKARTGNMISQFINILLAVYVFAISAISFYDLIQSINIFFLPKTSSIVVMLPFLIISAWSAYYGLKSIVYVSAALLPIVSTLGVFVALFTAEEKDYSYLIPVLVDGYDPVIKGTVIIIGGSAEMLILLLLQQHVKKPFTMGNIFVLVTILFGLILGPTMGALTSFGPTIVAEMRFPAFEQWRLITLGEYISHVDFLAVFQLLSGEIIRISLGFYLLSDMFKSDVHPLRKKIVFAITSILLGTITIIPISDIWIQSFMQKYFYAATVAYSAFITFALLIISLLPIKKGMQSL